MHQHFDDEHEAIMHSFYHEMVNTFDDLSNGRVSDAEAERRLAVLRWEQAKYEELRSTMAMPHELDFRCACSRCARCYTITHPDHAFLQAVGICWNHESDSVVLDRIEGYNDGK